MENNHSAIRKPGIPKPGLASVILGIVFLRLRSFANRRTLIKVVLAASVFAVLAGLGIEDLNQARFEVWLFDIFTSTIMGLICLSVGGSFLRREIKDSTIEYLWTRPIGKTKLVIGAYVSAVGVLCVFCIVFNLSLLVVGIYRNVPDPVALFPYLLFAQFFGSLAFCGIALMFSVFSGKYLLFGMVYGLLFEKVVSQIPTNLNNLSVSHHLSSIVWGGGKGLMTGSLGCLLIGGISLVLACLIFSFKQYRVGSSKES